VPTRSLARALARLEQPGSPQALVDLLKRPECTGAAREAILFELGQRFPDRPGVGETERRLVAASAALGPLAAQEPVRRARAFASLWGCVEYLRRQRPEIDLASPPRRPAAPGPARE
jgi:hypothetical protein